MNIFIRVLAGLWLCLMAVGAQAEYSALARLDPQASAILANTTGTRITLGLSQSVPFRAYLLDNPRRLVADFREVDFASMSPAEMLATQGQDGLIRDLRWGKFRPGWSRMVAELLHPAEIETAVAVTADDPHIEIRLVPTTVQKFDQMARTGAAASTLWDLPQPAETEPAHRRQNGGRALRVVLDPGHGGIDPGAEVDGLQEKVLTLTFARQLKEQMARAGMDVTLTRAEDMFVPLETRLTLARSAGADAFISLHADVLPQGEASGTAIYLMDDHADAEVARKLAERHNRDDLLSGVNLEGHDDNVANVLMDLARTETQPRSARLAQVLSDAVSGAGLEMVRQPVQRADFSVLKAPDMPSVLIELGFMSSKGDRQRLLDPEWRSQMAEVLTEGVLNWAKVDAAEARLLRR